MRIITAAQGSPAWHGHRALHDNASDAAAMLGIDPYRSRNNLLHTKHAGVPAEVDAGTQKRFDDGHKYEAIARPWAEEIIDDELYPVTLAEEIDGLALSASYDGITMDNDIAFEHKTLNAAIAAAMDAGEILEHHRAQMEQQLMVSGATRCLFMASAGERETMRHAWYESDPAMRQCIVAGWHQFADDLAAYIPPEPEKHVTGAAPEHLPALRIEVEGKVLATNLDDYKSHALAVLDAINEDLQTDNDFADAEATVKWCKGVEDRLTAAKDHALSQAGDIHDLLATVDEIAETTRQKRLTLDKLVKTEKQARREAIVRNGRTALSAHIGQINQTLGGKILMPDVAADFAGPIKGKRTLASIQDAVDTTLANAKIEASQIADAIRVNLGVLRSDAEGYETLFADAQTLVTTKGEDDLRNLVKARIAAAQEQEAQRIAAAQERQAQRDTDARRQADAAANTPPLAPERAPPKQPAGTTVATPAQARRPSDTEIIVAVARAFGVTGSVAREWLARMDISEAA